MSITFEHALEAKEKFKQFYMNDKYPINMISISKTGIWDKTCSEDEKDDYCLHVGLSRPLEGGEMLPVYAFGIWIFTEVVGEIVAL